MLDNPPLLFSSPFLSRACCKFGDSLEESFDELAPDGLTETITPLQRETMVAKIAS